MFASGALAAKIEGAGRQSVRWRSRQKRASHAQKLGHLGRHDATIHEVPVAYVTEASGQATWPLGPLSWPPRGPSPDRLVLRSGAFRAKNRYAEDCEH